jgi:hypothetical protein
MVSIKVISLFHTRVKAAGQPPVLSRLIGVARIGQNRTKNNLQVGLGPAGVALCEPPATSHGGSMSDTVESLILDLLEWIGPDSRPYPEVLDAWRTSCPRLPVWEDANDRGFVASHHEVGRGRLISVSVAGREHLREQRPSCANGYLVSAAATPTLPAVQGGDWLR